MATQQCDARSRRFYGSRSMRPKQQTAARRPRAFVRRWPSVPDWRSGVYSRQAIHKLQVLDTVAGVRRDPAVPCL